MPYLKTTNPFGIRGVEFHSSADIDTNPKLTSEDQEHLKAIITFFYDEKGQSIQEMIYAIVPADEKGRMSNEYAIRILEAKQIFAYLHTMPTKHGDTFLNSEHADTYIVIPEMTPRAAILDFGDDDSEYESIDGLIQCYRVIVNLVDFVLPSPKPTIYPPSPLFGIHMNHKVDGMLEQLYENSKLWALNKLIYSQNDDFIHDKLYVAMEWYNRSCSINAHADTSLVSLAIAFETLVGLSGYDSKTNRFIDSILVLLGDHPRLRSWAEQFYKIRSSIVHEGYSEDYKYHATHDMKKLKNAQGKAEIATYGYLTRYGKHIFRLCLNAILGSQTQAKDTYLIASFYHNHERLGEIQKILNDTSLDKETLIKRVSANVEHLYDHSFRIEDEELRDFEQILSTGYKLVERVLELELCASIEDNEYLEKVLNHSDDIVDRRNLHQRDGIQVIWEDIVKMIEDDPAKQTDLLSVSSFEGIKEKITELLSTKESDDTTKENLNNMTSLIDQVILSEKLGALASLKAMITMHDVLREYGRYIGYVALRHHVPWWSVKRGKSKE